MVCPAPLASTLVAAQDQGHIGETAAPAILIGQHTAADGDNDGICDLLEGCLTGNVDGEELKQEFPEAQVLSKPVSEDRVVAELKRLIERRG